MIKYDYVKTRREDVQPIKDKQVPIIRFFMRWATRLNVAIFRASKGRLMNKFIGGYPVCIVTTTGAKSGKTRRIALIHLPHGENKLLVASQGGMNRNPVWYYNIVAHPDISIMVDGEEKPYRARQVSATVAACRTQSAPKHRTGTRWTALLPLPAGIGNGAAFDIGISLH